MCNLLCLFGDFDKTSIDEASDTVSLNDTTGSEIINSIPVKSSLKSFKQISKCNSPAPATMCSPDSSV